MSRYFRLEEFLRSDTALKKKIDNTPSWEVIGNLNEMVEQLLDPLREAWGSGIRVSSGFRNATLNRMVGGVSNSAHLYGLAVDVVPVNGKMDEFEAFLKRWLPKSGRNWDQVIFETSGGSRWVHIGYRKGDGSQRRKVFGLVA